MIDRTERFVAYDSPVNHTISFERSRAYPGLNDAWSRMLLGLPRYGTYPIGPLRDGDCRCCGDCGLLGTLIGACLTFNTGINPGLLIEPALDEIHLDVRGSQMVFCANPGGSFEGKISGAIKFTPRN